MIPVGALEVGLDCVMLDKRCSSFSTCLHSSSCSLGNVGISVYMCRCVLVTASVETRLMNPQTACHRPCTTGGRGEGVRGEGECGVTSAVIQPLRLSSPRVNVRN